jgi:AAA domain/Viral (Superfamily 1) RNA helicase
MLNIQQQEVFNNIQKIIDRQTGGLVLIEGEAGTGKTFTIAEVIQRSSIYAAEVCITAPTDKAKDNLGLNLPDYNCLTIHSLLGYYPTSDSEGKQFLASIPDRRINYSVVVVDEIMCCPNILIMAMLERPDILWILLGDEGQLKAIGDDSSILNDPDTEFLYRYTLTIQERSKGTCYPLIQQIKAKGLLYGPVDFLKKTKFQAQFIDDLDQNIDSICISFTNKAADDFAKFIRIQRYDTADPTPIAGERIKIKQYSDAKGKKIIPSNAIVTVLNVTSTGFNIKYENKTVFCKFLPVNYLGFSVLDEIKQEIASTNNRLKKQQLWTKFYSLESQYARWSSAFSSTVHSYQGITCDNVYLQYRDILRCKDDPNILYTAASRARNFVYFGNF